MSTPELREKICRAIGAASMCWDPLPGAQVFDSTRALAISEDLEAAIAQAIADAVAEERESIAQSLVVLATAANGEENRTADWRVARMAQGAHTALTLAAGDVRARSHGKGVEE